MCFLNKNSSITIFNGLKANKQVFQIEILYIFVYKLLNPVNNKLIIFLSMFATRIQQNFLLIESHMEKRTDPQKVISLFYSTIKLIQKEENQLSKSNCFSSVVSPFLNSMFDMNQSANKYSFRVQDLFNEFLDNFRKQNCQLDKVNHHMFKLTTQMVSKLNQKNVQTYYRNNFHIQQSSAEQHCDHNLNNYSRLQRARSLSNVNRIDQIIVNQFEDVNLNHGPGSQNTFQVQKMKNKFITNQNKKTNSKKNSRLSQNTVESTSSRQILQNHVLKLNNNPSSSSQNANVLKQQIQLVVKYYNDHKIDEAFEHLTNLQTNYALDNQFQKFISTLSENSKQKLQKIKVQYDQMQFYYKYFDLTGYKLDKKQGNITMHYKIMEKQNLVAIQVQSEVNITIQRFLSITSEIQLYDKYVPFNYETKCLSQPSRNTKIGRSKVFIPLLNNRQAYFEAKAYDRLRKQNNIFIFSKNLKKDNLTDMGIQYKSQGLIDLDYIFFLISYSPVTKQKGIIKMATCVDMKINILPKFIMNKTARMFAFDYFKNMINIAKNFDGSVWDNAIKSKPEHYSFFRQKINQYYAFKQQNKSKQQEDKEL